MLSFHCFSSFMGLYVFFCNCGLNLFSSKVLSSWTSLKMAACLWLELWDMLYRLLKLWMKGTIAWREKLMHLFMSGDCKHTALRIWKRGRTAWRNGWRRIIITEQRDSQKTLCVAGVLTIDPPYGPENCNSSNEIILSRVQDLIQGHLEASQWEAKNYGCTDWNKISYFWKFFVVLGKIKDGDYRY